MKSHDSMDRLIGSLLDQSMMMTPDLRALRSAVAVLGPLLDPSEVDPFAVAHVCSRSKFGAEYYDPFSNGIVLDVYANRT